MYTSIVGLFIWRLHHHFFLPAILFSSIYFCIVEGIHHGADHPQPVIAIVHQEDIGHHLPTGRLDWVSLERISLLQDLAMPPLSEIWRRNLASLDV
jgi:hypothetical protein